MTLKFHITHHITSELINERVAKNDIPLCNNVKTPVICKYIFQHYVKRFPVKRLHRLIVLQIRLFFMDIFEFRVTTHRRKAKRDL